MNSAVGNGPRLSIGMDTVARLEEMQQLIHRLKEENKTLTKKLQDAQEESWFKNLKEGHNYLAESNQSVEQELDNLTKEDVSKLYFLVSLMNYLNHLHRFSWCRMVLCLFKQAKSYCIH